MTAPPAVSVILRCRNEALHMGPVLDALVEQAFDRPVEVIALDSGSTDGTLDLLAARRVRVERLAGEFSFGRALNCGAELARAPIVVFLSAHCPPRTPHWLTAITAPFADPTVVATFGRQVPLDDRNPIEQLTQARMFPERPPAGVLFSNANSAVRRAAVLARPFDEEIPAAEDHLWATNVTPPDRIVYVPAAVVGHSHPMTFREWRYRFYINGLAAEHARRRRAVDLPWGMDETPGAIVRGRAGAFVRLALALARGGYLRALGALPAYAVARTLAYPRGLRDGARRYATGPDRSHAAEPGIP
jgi:glycosyltransferase involved in cell wall biosynthesis